MEIVEFPGVGLFATLMDPEGNLVTMHEDRSPKSHARATGASGRERLIEARRGLIRRSSRRAASGSHSMRRTSLKRRATYSVVIT
ncbi:MAG TPA: hypothetical protein VNA69_02790 [Thermoanaerobaculia bacterium]|nr:hypothetical protein [Thermoanaerobaculia bacterium]